LEEIIGGVIAIISFRPGGRMQQSAVPRCAILSVGSTEASGSETPRVHHADWLRGGCVAARGGRNIRRCRWPGFFVVHRLPMQATSLLASARA